MMPYQRTILATPYIQRAERQLQARFGKDCTLKEITARSKEQHLAAPRRYFAAYLRAVWRNNPDAPKKRGARGLFSLPHIKKVMGRKCHTSVLNNIAAAHETWGQKHFDDLVCADWPEWVSGKPIYEAGSFVSGHGWEIAA